jgi:hypothetical protein
VGWARRVGGTTCVGVGQLVWLAQLLGWLAGLGDKPMDPSPRVIYIYMRLTPM